MARDREALIEELRAQREAAAREAEAAHQAEQEPWGAGDTGASTGTSTGTAAGDAEALFRR